MASKFFFKTKDLVLSAENANAIKQLRLKYYSIDRKVRESIVNNQKELIETILEKERLSKELFKKNMNSDC